MSIKPILLSIVILLFWSISGICGTDIKFVGKILMTPYPAETGETVSFSISLTTIGGAAKNLKLIGGVDGEILAETIFKGIADGGTRRYNMKWIAIPGSHTAWFELDSDHLLNDEDYSNNRIELKINMEGEPEKSDTLPDLTVEDGSVKPQAEQGEKIMLGCYVQNKGGNIIGQWNVRFLIDNKEIASQDYNGIPSGGLQTYHYEYVVNAVGLHTMTCQADPKNQIPESDESNNGWTSSFNVSEKVVKLPDISIKKIWTEPSKITEGDHFTFNCSYEFDQGISEKPFQIWIVQPSHGAQLGRGWDMTDIKSGTFSVQWEATKAGKHEYYCDVDRTNQISESDEKNNSAASEFIINPKAITPEQDMYITELRIEIKNEKTIWFCCGIGTKNFTQPFDYKYLLDGKLLSTEQSTNGYGGCQSFTMDQLSPGQHTLECVIDPNNKVPELDENNNNGKKIFNIETKQELPDLVAQSVSTDKKKYSEGEEVQVICFYKNIGGAFQGNWRLMLFVGRDSEYSNSVTNTSGYVPWTWKAKGVGKYNVGCSLDTQQQVKESNEQNNTVTDAIEVIPANNPIKGIILFEHDNYGGIQEIFTADNPDLRYSNIGNDKASSIKVPAGCTATLYEHINYQGKNEIFRSNDNWLGDNSIGNDSVSSIKVKCSK